MTTAAFDAEIYRRLREAAFDERAAITEIVRQGVAEWLARRERRPSSR